MSETLRWWLVLQVVSLIALPLCLALFRRLPDRGYTLSKAFALLVLGYTFWLLNSLHVLPNSRGGIIAALLALGALSALFVYRERADLEAWVRDRWQYVVAVEVAFFAVFIVAVWLRSLVGQISGTEQPMDLMFLNASTRAEHFPPKDPWLSGSTVAYYYFGYLIVAMTGMLAGVPTEFGYNIGLGMIAALSMLGGFGIVYNLVAMREAAAPAAGAASPDHRAAAGRPARDEKKQHAVTPAGAAPRPNWRPGIFGAAGAVMLVVMGNLVWVLVFASAYGIGGPGFYKWIDIDGLRAHELRATWYPSEYFGFFNASRIYPLNDSDFRAITEFPMFSFILGDLHPHVMALPFVILVVGVALALYRSREPLDITFWLARPLALAAAAVMLGGLAFINTWDIATMAFVVVAAAFASNFLRVRALTADLFVQAVTFALPLVLLAIVAYLPFYTSFTSQADGILPVVTRPGIDHSGTRPVHALIYWGPLFAVVVPFVVSRLLAARDRISPRMYAIAAAVPAAILGAWAALFVWATAIRDNPKMRDVPSLGTQIADRGSGWLTALGFAALVGVALLALWTEVTAGREDDDERESPVFALLLAATAFLLMLGTEFFYVGDVFNSRMNTVFKLYYQAWMLMAIAAGFALYYLSATWRFSFDSARTYRLGWGALAAIMLAGAMLYPLGGTYNRTQPHDDKGNLIETGGELDGLNYLPPAELDAIRWLNQRAQGQEFVIVEGVGNDYSRAGRISMATGIPTVLGWGGHEDQWRGGTPKARAGRFEDVEALYTTNDMARVEQIVKKYDVTYIVAGDFERTRYGAAALDKFNTLPVAFQSGGVIVYLAKS